MCEIMDRIHSFPLLPFLQLPHMISHGGAEPITKGDETIQEVLPVSRVDSHPTANGTKTMSNPLGVGEISWWQVPKAS